MRPFITCSVRLINLYRCAKEGLYWQCFLNLSSTYNCTTLYEVCLHILDMYLHVLDQYWTNTIGRWWYDSEFTVSVFLVYSWSTLRLYLICRYVKTSFHANIALFPGAIWSWWSRNMELYLYCCRSFIFEALSRVTIIFEYRRALNNHTDKKGRKSLSNFKKFRKLLVGLAIFAVVVISNSKLGYIMKLPIFCVHVLHESSFISHIIQFLFYQVGNHVFHSNHSHWSRQTKTFALSAATAIHKFHTDYRSSKMKVTF